MQTLVFGLQIPGLQNSPNTENSDFGKDTNPLSLIAGDVNKSSSPPPKVTKSPPLSPNPSQSNIVSLKKLKSSNGDHTPATHKEKLPVTSANTKKVSKPLSSLKTVPRHKSKKKSLGLKTLFDENPINQNYFEAPSNETGRKNAKSTSDVVSDGNQEISDKNSDLTEWVHVSSENVI